MKVTLGSFEVSINAKHSWQHCQNKKATLEFLNYLSVIFSEASDNYKKEDYEHLAKTSENIRKELYNICDAHGLYNK